MNKLICLILGHKKVYLVDAIYEGEVDGWFCVRCNYQE